MVSIDLANCRHCALCFKKALLLPHLHVMWHSCAGCMDQHHAEGLGFMGMVGLDLSGLSQLQ